MRTRDMLRSARQMGKDAGHSAATWVFDGNNTTDATYRKVLAGIMDGDPEVMDSLNVPNLSGEWADSETPGTLADNFGLDSDNDPDGYRLDAVCSAWEEACGMAFWAEVERTARYHVS